MKKLFLLLSTIALVSFTSCKEKATEKINQENVEKAAERCTSHCFSLCNI